MMIEMEFVTEEMEDSREGRWSGSEYGSGEAGAAAEAEGWSSDVFVVLDVSAGSVELLSVEGVVVEVAALVVVCGTLKSCTIYETSFSTISFDANSRANRFDAGAGSIRPDAGVGVAIEMIPFIRSATALCVSLECSGESISTSRGIKFWDDSHYTTPSDEQRGGAS